MSAYHLAQYNIAWIKAPLDSPEMADFTDNIADINALAEAAPGFVWRHQTAEGDSTSVRVRDDDRIIINFSVWTDSESLFQFAFYSGHADYYRRRMEWFTHDDDPFAVLWWVPEGHEPTVEEAEAKLAELKHHGPNQSAFTFKKRFSPPSAEVRKLAVEDVGLVASIDRSEHVEVEYSVVDSRLAQRPVSISVPPWDVAMDGPHSVAAHVAFVRPLVAGGASLFGAFEGDRLLGLAVVDPTFEPGLGWLAFLHVSREARRRGAASQLWSAAVREARHAGAESLYVSATPTGSAVGFYLSRGCSLADPVHPKLFAMEPDDIHLVCPIP